MTGVWFNCLGLLLAAGLAPREPDRHGAAMSRVHTWLGVFALYVGTTLLLAPFRDSLSRGLRAVGIALAALILGNLVGKAARLQKASNRVGSWAMNRLGPGSSATPGERWSGVAALVLANPVGWVGAAWEAVSGDWRILALKTFLDALALVAWVGPFGRSLAVVAIPAGLALAGVEWAMRPLAAVLESRGLLECAGAATGWYLFAAASTLFGGRKAPLADYLPALGLAPLLAWWWR
ncbi:MAG: DUF554 family protein [Verrucomicrobiota bacterium]